MPDAGPDMAVEMDIVRVALEERDRRIAQLVTDTTTLRQLENEVVGLREVNAEMLAALKQIRDTASGEAWSKLIARAVIAAVEDKT
jgi:hypothetical protein